jgi:hypothetical protein
MSHMRRPLAIALVFVVVAFGLGFRIAHPHSGLKNALGSANSGLVVYKKTGEFKIGDKVLVNITPEDQSPVLAIVRASDASKLEIQSTTEKQSVDIDAAFGRLVLMIPFLGSIAQAIGL